MKKRLTALLLLVCMLLTMVPVGAAAENTEGEPVAQEAGVQQDNEGGSDDQPAPVANPEPVAPCANGHSWDGVWHSLENGKHAQKCKNCDTYDTAADCDYADATCTAGKTCKVCGYISSDPLPHNWGEWTSKGDGTHTRKCKTCGTTETNDCSGGTASCKDKAKCEVCGASYGDYQHFVTECRHIDDTNTHGYYCTNPLCRELLATETYGYSSANCASPAECTKCFNQKGSKDPTNHVGETKAERVPGTETHNIVCQGCKKAIDENVPCTSDGKADCLNKAKCTVCGSDMGEFGDHVIKNSPATCTKAAVCDVCGKEVGNPLGHDRDGDGPCKRGANCDCEHPNLWKGVDASTTSAKCSVCGKTVDKTPLNVNFTVNGYGIGKPIDGLTASCDDSHITDVKASAVETARASSKTFQANTKYTITISYKTADGYMVQAATINGTPAQTGTGSSSINMSEPEKLYTITYKGIDGATFTGTLPTEYTASSLPITLPDSATKTGYTFDGWTGNGTTTPTKNVTIKTGTTGNLVFTANFTANKYTVTYKAGAHGTDPKPNTVTVTYGNKCSAPAIYDNDYIVDYWMKPDGTAYNFSTPVTADLTLTAHWVAASYVTFSGSSYGTRQYADGTKIDLKKMKPAKSGYYFCGWFSDKAMLHPASNPLVVGPDNVTIYAKWKRVDPTNPKTGDTQYPELAAGILAFSVVSLGAVTLISKKKRFF